MFEKFSNDLKSYRMILFSKFINIQKYPEYLNILVFHKFMKFVEFLKFINFSKNKNIIKNS